MSITLFYAMLGLARQEGFEPYFDHKGRIRLKRPPFGLPFCPITAVHYIEIGHKTNTAYGELCFIQCGEELGFTRNVIQRFELASDSSDRHPHVRRRLLKALGLKESL